MHDVPKTNASAAHSRPRATRRWQGILAGGRTLTSACLTTARASNCFERFATAALR